MKMMKIIAVAASVVTMLCFAGCGLEDSLLEGEVSKMAEEHFKSQDEIGKLWTIEKSSNFVMEPEANGKRMGTLDLELKNMKTGARQKLAYQFSYDVERSEVEVGVKNPADAMKLLGIE